jgi:hypothetical protein
MNCLRSWISLAFLLAVLHQVGYADKHIVVTESMGSNSLSGSVTRTIVEPLSLAIHLESFETLTLSSEWSIRGSYYLDDQRLGRFALGYGRIFYLSNIGRAESKSDASRTWRETEPVSYGVHLGLEAGRQVLRSFPDLGYTEAVAEFLGVRVGGRVIANLSEKYAPMLTFSVCYNRGFGRFAFDGLIIEAGLGISFPW